MVLGEHLGKETLDKNLAYSHSCTPLPHRVANGFLWGEEN